MQNSNASRDQEPRVQRREAPRKVASRLRRDEIMKESKSIAFQVTSSYLLHLRVGSVLQ